MSVHFDVPLQASAPQAPVPREVRFQDLATFISPRARHRFPESFATPLPPLNANA